jgi:hypothetical protein
VNLDFINKRVDEALAANRRAEGIIIGLSVGIFLLGVAALILAYWYTNPYVATGAILFQGLLYWPIGEIRRLRRENVSLQAVPALVSTFPPDKAVLEIRTLLRFIRGEKQ